MSRRRQPKEYRRPTEEEIARMFAETKGDRPSSESIERPICDGCGRPVSRRCGPHCFAGDDNHPRDLANQLDDEYPNGFWGEPNT